MIIIQNVFIAKNGKAIEKNLNRNYSIEPGNIERYRNWHKRRAVKKYGKDVEVYLIYKEKMTENQYKYYKNRYPDHCENV